MLYRDSGQRGGCVVLCSRRAVEEGVRSGMPLSEARALLENRSAPHFEPYDAHASHEALRMLAQWCQQFCPVVGLEEADAPQCLLLDITGCAHLFQGERRLAEQVVDAFWHRGFFVHVAVADTIGAAWAVSHYGHLENSGSQSPREESRRTIHNPQSGGSRVHIVPPGRQRTALRPLPTTALRLPEKIVDTLQELGIRSIEELQRLPRASLPSRFGPAILTRLDQALGQVPELLIPERFVEPIEVTWPFEYPVADRRAIQTVLKQLIARAVEQLGPRQQGIQQFRCRLEITNGAPLVFSVGLVRPSLSVSHLFGLALMQLERIDLEKDVVQVQLRVTETIRLESHQRELFNSGTDGPGREHLNALVDRLSSRLGEAAVLRPFLYEDAQPEYASGFEPMVFGKMKAEGGRMETFHSTPQTTKAGAPCANFALDARTSFGCGRQTGHAGRPLCLKAAPIPISVTSNVPEGPPIRFRWKNRDHVVAHSWGPERLETGWWRSRHVCRDYYRVETTQGQRFWLFRKVNEEKWFLHGEFD